MTNVAVSDPTQLGVVDNTELEAVKDAVRGGRLKARVMEIGRKTSLIEVPTDAELDRLKSVASSTRRA